MRVLTKQVIANRVPDSQRIEQTHEYLRHTAARKPISRLGAVKRRLTVWATDVIVNRSADWGHRKDASRLEDSGDRQPID